MAPLDRTFALAETYHLAVFVRQYLKFDVPRILHVLFHVEVAIAEGLRRFGLRLLVKSGEIVFLADDAHAASATAGRSLDDDRESDLPRPFDRFIHGTDYAVGTGEDRHAVLLHGGASFFFFTHQANHVRRRADELDVAGLTHFREVGVLG